MNVTNAAQSGFIGVNRGLDNAPRAASDVTGSGQPDQPELASGQAQDSAVVESAVGPNVQAASTQVVSQAAEPGAPGSLIDVRV